MSLTLKQCAEKAGGMPASTAAYYRDMHMSFFTIEGEGRSRTYDDRTPDLLVEVGKLYKEGLSRQQVDEALGKRHPPVVTADLVTLTVFREELKKRDVIILELQEELASVKLTLLRVEDSFRSAEKMDREIMEVISTRYKNQRTIQD